MIFVDTWAWVALASAADQYHASATTQHHRFKTKRKRYVTTNFVLNEVITHLYRKQSPQQAAAFVNGLIAAFDRRLHRFIEITSEQFRRAWTLRQKYDDKPDITFVDFTSMVTMQDLGITDVFTGDDHFRKVNLGFRLVP